MMPTPKAEPTGGNRLRFPSSQEVAVVWLRTKTIVWFIFFALQVPSNILAADESPAATDASLEKGFSNPPAEARLRAYWWWLNGNVTKPAITRDLEEMAAKGFGGALIADAGGAEQDGNDPVPHGPDFFSPQWRELYRHALQEADRLGLEISLQIQSGWNLGGPMIQAADAPKKLIWSDFQVSGPSRLERRLPEPNHHPEFYRDVAVVAYPLNPGLKHRPIENWDKKALHKPLSFSAPDTSLLLRDLPAQEGEQDMTSSQVVDLTSQLAADGTVRWDVPAGQWEILRFGCTLNNRCRVSTCSVGWAGYALDPYDARAFRSYWDQVVEPLIADAGPLAGRTLKYLHTDSWEVEGINWTPTLLEEFRKRRGYDLQRYLPVIVGRIVDSRPVSNRFLNDYRRTIGDLAIDNHYRLFVEGAHRHNLLIHPESGGPHAVPIDAQQCLGMDDAPMAEFWAKSWKHRVRDADRFFVKQPASAAHTYGRRCVCAEGFTTIGPHWQETLWDNLKPSFDRAACEGLNRLFWHAFVCSPSESGLPGQQYFAGTHINPNSTWWSRSAPFLAYINRCQYLLQQGLFVADVCFYYGDHVPNFTQLKSTDPAAVLPGYDYDVITEEAIVERLSVRDGRLVLPDGMSYSLLVLPDRPCCSLAALRKLKALVEAGATVIGPKPAYASGLTDYPRCDQEVGRIAGELWADCDGKTVTEHRAGKGRVIYGRTARQVLQAGGVAMDFELVSAPAGTAIDYIHRRAGNADIYFVANGSDRVAEIECIFRVSGRQPELWDPVAGTTRSATAWSQSANRTTLPLEFGPYGSLFVVFRKPVDAAPAVPAGHNFLKWTARHSIAGPWTVRFDPKWGGPATAEFPELISWTLRPETGIEFYSGTATYQKSFDLPEPLRQPGTRLMLDLGQVKNLAEVRLNGQQLGVLWSFPFRTEITEVLRAENNQLDIDVVNFWPNRVIGDESLPKEQRLTRTNIRKLTARTAPLESGLLGPVTIQTPDPASQ
jgi:hypothetical protein